jgi:hypothetical protein
VRVERQGKAGDDVTDEQQRAGWWIASDGKAYPPEARPPEADRPPPSPAWSAPGFNAPQPPAPPPGAPVQPPSYPAPPPPPPPPAPAYGSPWGAPQPYGGPPASTTPGLAIASLVLGVGALLFSLIPFVGFASLPFAIAGIVLGVIGLSRAKKGDGGRGLSIAGLSTSVIAILVSALYLVLFVVVADNTSDDINSDPSNGVCNSDRFFQDPDC